MQLLSPPTRCLSLPFLSYSVRRENWPPLSVPPTLLPCSLISSWIVPMGGTGRRSEGGRKGRWRFFFPIGVLCGTVMWLDPLYLHSADLIAPASSLPCALWTLVTLFPPTALSYLGEEMVSCCGQPLRAMPLGSSLDCWLCLLQSDFIQSLHGNYLKGILLPAWTLFDEPCRGAHLREPSGSCPSSLLFFTADFLQVASQYLGCPL